MSGVRSVPLRVIGLVVLLTAVVDLVTKTVAYRLPESAALISPARNDDLALGIASLDDGVLPLSVIVGVAALLLGHALTLSTRSRPSAAWCGLLLGGVVANLLDRTATGAVHDWLDLGVAVANVADLALVAGLAWYVVAAWRHVAQ